MRRGGYLSLGIKDIFDPKGRIDRLTYFMYGAILGIIGILVDTAVRIATLALSHDPIGSKSVLYLGIASVCLSLPILYGRFCINAKRLHDIGLTGALAVYIFLPTIYAFGINAIPHRYWPDFIAQNPDIGQYLYWGTIGIHCLLLLIPGQRGHNVFGKNAQGDELPKPRLLEG